MIFWIWLIGFIVSAPFIAANVVKVGKSDFGFPFDPTEKFLVSVMSFGLSVIWLPVMLGFIFYTFVVKFFLKEI